VESFPQFATRIEKALALAAGVPLRVLQDGPRVRPDESDAEARERITKMLGEVDPCNSTRF